MSKAVSTLLKAGLFALLIAGIDVGSNRPLFAQDAKPKEAEKKEGDAVENPFPDRPKAPELDGGIEWLNTSGPISLKDVRGKIVLLDFWTFCCINCMHVLPDLAYLEKKFANELVVIGVHSAKFDNEKESGNIRKAILRYEIEHPVVNDANMTIWRKYGVRSWPSLVVLDPEGNYVGSISGEGHREILEKVIERLIEYHKFKGTLDESPVHFAGERFKTEATALRFPGKLLIDEPNQRLFISDSNHNRLIVSDLTGRPIHVIGTGVIGKKDGGYAEAEFDHPQGMALVGDMLYVADTENHLLRTVDLKQKTVSTLAGTGEQDRTRAPTGTLTETPLNSPWDLTVVDGILYIAMAGPHQIWAHKLGSNTIFHYAGSGREDISDGKLDQAALAQPSGLVSDGTTLYVVDSEGSAVRSISTTPENDLTKPVGIVKTIAGTSDLPRGRSLFEFGDVDAVGGEARLQHPLGIAIHDNSLFVADSYNHKIKQIDLKTRAVSTWAGTGQPGTKLDPLELSEPAGLAIASGKLYVADTNNHRIVVIDMTTKQANEFKIEGLTAPTSIETSSVTPTTDPGKRITVEKQELIAKNDLKFVIDFELPEGFKLNDQFPTSHRLKTEGDQKLIAADLLNTKRECQIEGKTATFSLPISNKTGQTTLIVSVTFGYCREGEGGICKIGTTEWQIPISLTSDAKTDTVKLKAKVSAPANEKE